MSRWSLILFCTLWAASAQADAPPLTAHASEGAVSGRLLVQRFHVAGVEAKLARALEEAVVLDVGRRKGVTVVTAAEMEQTASFAKTQAELGCDVLDECLVEVQQKLQVERLISGKVSRLGGDYLLALGLLEVASKTVGRRVTRQAPDFPALLASVPAALEDLLGTGQQTRAFRLPPGQQLKLAVMPLSARGVLPATADAMTQILSAELNGIEGISVISRDDITAMLDKVQTEGALGCTDNMECIVEIGASLGLSKLVTGTVGKVDDTHVVSLQLVDIRRADVENRVLESFDGAVDELRHVIKLCAFDLVGVDYSSRKGRVDFTFNVAEAEIRLGPRKLALKNSQLSVEGMSPGRYSLRVIPDPDDYFPLQTDVYVAPSGDNVRTFHVEATPTPWYGRWWVWTIAGALVAGGVTSAVLLSADAPHSQAGTAVIP